MAPSETPCPRGVTWRRRGQRTGESGWLRCQAAAGLADSADGQVFQLTLRPHCWMMIAYRIPRLVIGTVASWPPDRHARLPACRHRQHAHDGHDERAAAASA